MTSMGGENWTKRFYWTASGLHRVNNQLYCKRNAYFNHVYPIIVTVRRYPVAILRRNYADN